MRSSSSSSSSSLSSLAELEPPGYVSGLGLNLKPAVPLPPAIDNGVAFPSMEKSAEPSVPTGLWPVNSNDNLKSCIKETPKPVANQSDEASQQASPTIDESPTTRKRRSVSFAVEEPIIHHLQTSTNAGGGNSETSLAVSDESNLTQTSPSVPTTEQSTIPFPSYESRVTRSRSLSSILPDRLIGTDTAGSLYTYIRSNALSTFSSRTSLSSEDWDSHSEAHSSVRSDPSWLYILLETALGLSLAIGWLAVGRVVGTIEPSPRQSRITTNNDDDESNSPRNAIES